MSSGHRQGLAAASDHVRRKVLDLLKGGRTVTQLAHDLEEYSAGRVCPGLQHAQDLRPDAITLPAAKPPIQRLPQGYSAGTSVPANGSRR